MNKQTFSLFRTLCLTALFCLTSLHAFAYKYLDYTNILSWRDLILNAETMGDDKIMVVNHIAPDIPFVTLYIDEGYALIILDDADMLVMNGFCNKGTIYCLGRLEIWGSGDNPGTINIGNYVQLLGKYNGGTINSGFSPDQMVHAIAPTPEQTGLTAYWEKKIVYGGDSYIFGYYADMDCGDEIYDLDEWKASEGLLEYKDAPVKIDGQQPNAENNYEGWKDYYKQVCTDYKGNNYTLYAEDEAFTQIIDDPYEWKHGRGMLTAFLLCGTHYFLENQNGNIVYDGDLTIPDKADYDSRADFTVKGTTTYSRSFEKSKGTWQCWYMPFDVDYSVLDEECVDAAEIAGILLDEDGNTAVAFKKIKNNEGYVLKANTPYVVRLRSDAPSSSLELKLENTTLREFEETEYIAMSMYDKFTFIGNYRIRYLYGSYTLNTSGVFQFMGYDNILPSMRFWLKIDTRTDSPYSNHPIAGAKKFIDFTVLGDDEITGIEANHAPTLSKANGTIYNLNGQKATHIQSGQVYIMNGKKYLAR